MEHGYAKLARGPEDFAHILHALGMPAPDLLAWATVLVELSIKLQSVTAAGAHFGQPGYETDLLYLMGLSARFPELVRAVHGDGSTREAITLIGDLLAREPRDSTLSAEKRAFAAEQFIFMAVTLPQRRAMGYGTPMTAAELDVWADKTVDLLLNGCRGWTA